MKVDELDLSFQELIAGNKQTLMLNEQADG